MCCSCPMSCQTTVGTSGITTDLSTFFQDGPFQGLPPGSPRPNPAVTRFSPDALQTQEPREAPGPSSHRGSQGGMQSVRNGATR